MRFDDRESAGLLLAHRLQFLAGDDLVVVGLARGGVMVASAVARTLEAPLDTVIVAKVTAPQAPDVALGAIAEDGTLVVNHDVVRQLGIDRTLLGYAITRTRTELIPRVKNCRRIKRLKPVHGKTVVLIDDGIATGASMRAAIRMLKARGAGRIVMAVPIAPMRTLGAVAAEVDHTNCPHPLRWMRAVEDAYLDFPKLHDTEVLATLRLHANSLARRSARPRTAIASAPASVSCSSTG